MRRRFPPVALICVVAALLPAAAEARTTLQPYRISDENLQTLRARFLNQLQERQQSGWVPLRFELGDRELKLMGLPSKRYILSHRFRQPTMVTRGKGGKPGGGKPSGGGGGGGGTSGQAVPLPTLAAYAGAGWFGIRPGALLLSVTDNSIGWCTMAHVYGSPGSYSISTAGHCGKTGDRATMIAAAGNRADIPVLLDFGTFGTSHDNGLGDDFALIPVASQYQSLVTPTMIFWGGPRGVFTKTGAVATVSPSVSVNPDPFLAQQIVHYGHGTGVGNPGVGTPRSGTAIHWGTRHLMFFGAISPGDSGSGANTLLGDTVGANMEAAGILTHLWIDSLMRDGLGIMGATRVTQVGTPANGQIVPYPAPVPAGP